MKRTKKFVLSVLFIIMFSCLRYSGLYSQNRSKPMNVIFILADDLGWSDCTLYGNTDFYQTPNLERLASQGITFTHAYVSALSSPTRASILTGQTTARHGITAPVCHRKEAKTEPSVDQQKVSPGNKALPVASATRLDNDLPTLAKVLKAQGYTTGHFGKWHLGHEPYSPLEHGFDEDIPHWPGPGPAGSYVAPWKFPDYEANYPREHIEDRMAEEAIEWMRKVADKDQPFYMNYWAFSVHGPWDAKESLIKYYRTKTDLTDLQHSPTYAAMIHSLDQAVGRLIDEVGRLGISNNTAVIFLGDNGGNIHCGLVETLPSGEEFIAPVTDNTPLRGGKGNLWEGGTRVPCVVSWPGITKSGTRTDAMIHSTDFYPTILNLLDIDLPENYPVDGVDITPALQGKELKRKAVISYFPHQVKVPDWLPPAVAVHSGDWKLIRSFYHGDNGEHAYKLYNLKWDIGEKNNLADQYPQKVKELDRIIEEHLRNTNAVVPQLNPNFVPAQYHPEDIGKQKGGYRMRSDKKKIQLK
ncbi:N-acetylgalactosamine 6-sulfate sulfatase [candidate division MSBL1 archaeon SCGC-AAA382M17]|uniref:N-acetylgalactosamine 6-sulfate sulfatase n=1 Tax=candidate division MSBL1 archaeon SCGC-AAA382M17 TaxID=1698284 RepID=A0ABR5TJJ8_9EURY|nr:N-acetylgalactosamine 6-sulfate sulfatase [candidate division MSBL1 archaeon SCGC-AAA382M17]